MLRVHIIAQTRKLSTCRILTKEKTPLQVFVETFRKEWGKSKELQDNIKALQNETGRIADNEAFIKAKEAFELAQKSRTATSKHLKRAAGAVGSVAEAAWDSPIIKSTRSAVGAAAEGIDKATEPIRKTKVYKDVKEVIDDGSSIRYGGFEDRQARRLRRTIEKQKRIKEEFQSNIKKGPIMSNENAGQNIVLHATAKAESYKHKIDKNSLLGKTRSGVVNWWEESDNGFIATLRAVTSKISHFFDETESGKVIRMFKQMDPSFDQETFMKTVREYIIPEVLEAWVKGDAKTLKIWLSEAPYNIWETQTKQFTEQSMISDGRILDIRGVEIVSAKILPPSDIPVYVISCRAQEVHIYRKTKTGELVAGIEDNIQQTTYVIVITRIPEQMLDEETGGWKILELVRGLSRSWT